MLVPLVLLLLVGVASAGVKALLVLAAAIALFLAVGALYFIL